MKTNMTREEMEADLKATHDDIERLAAIVENLRGFVLHSAGEDRSGFRMDLFKYESLLLQAQRLAVSIENRLNPKLLSA